MKTGFSDKPSKASSITVIGTVREGKFIPDNPTIYSNAFCVHEGKRVEVTIGRVTTKRSGEQNKYYWGVVIAILSQHTGYTPEEMHDALRVKFLSETGQHSGLVITRSTTTLTKEEVAQYIEKIQKLGAELGCYIPDADEVVGV